MDKKDNLTIISYVKPFITLNSLNEKVCSFNGYIFTETQLINLIKGYNTLEQSYFDSKDTIAKDIEELINLKLELKNEKELNDRNDRRLE